MRFRPEIDGLRAVAVSLVILCHLSITGFSGGYIGVDIFFVISGFLITNLLISEYQSSLATGQNGFISFRNFYIRRVKRIVPMALTVIIAALVYGYFNYSQARFSQVRNDAIWASLFGANIHYMQESLNYFQQAQAVSLLQHYWSLAVEEQFYLIFPAFFLIFARVKTKAKPWLVAPLVAVALVSLASLLSAITTSSQNQSYFSSFDRAYELGIGALLALVLALRKFNLTNSLSNSLSITGISLIAFSVISFDESSKFPGTSALVPTLGTALIIFSEMNSAKLSVVGSTLATKPIVFIGKLSYSIYLWHWLVMIIVKDQISGSALLINTLIIVVTFALSFLGYKFIEHPIRKLPVPARFTQPIAISGRSKALAATASFLSIALVVAVATGRIELGSKSEVVTSPAIQSTPSPTQEASQTPAPIASASSSTEPSTQASVEPTVAASVSAKPTTQPSAKPSAQTSSKPTPVKVLSYAELVDAFKEKVSDGNMLNEVPVQMWPTISQLMPLRSQQWRNCMDVAIRAVTCEFGNKSADKTAVILGDSYALAVYNTVLGALDLTKWHVVTLNMRECMVADVVPYNWGEAGGIRADCAPHRQWTFDYLKELKPDLIFLSDQPTHPIANGDKDAGDAQFQLWEEGLQRSIQTLGKLNSKVVYFGVPDSGWGTSLINCTNAQGDLKKSCFGSIAWNRNYVVAQKYATESIGGLFIDVKGWICDLGTCPPIIDNTPVFYDGAHFSEAFATKMAPLLAALLREKRLIN
jgi:peptidoglycan/LPS O-acetylase OafA/YrhL